MLKAGGAETLIDRARFKAGGSVIGQMNDTQDQANKHLICVSAEYACSDYCLHELRRAVAKDHDASRMAVLPLRIDASPLEDVPRIVEG